MGVTAERDVRRSLDVPDIDGGYVFWANYGDRTRVRCAIAQTAVDDYFSNNADEKQSLSATRKHWDAIWQIFERKIPDGRIEIISGRPQTILQVELTSRDLGDEDFR